VLANHLAVVDGFQPFDLVLADIDVEVIAPEIDHDLKQLAFAADRAQ
jgi:hypothetical protein